jgi:hypothetical protein
MFYHVGLVNVPPDLPLGGQKVFPNHRGQRGLSHLLAIAFFS